MYHGSRDPRPQIEVERLAQFVCQNLREGEFEKQRDRRLQNTHTNLLGTPSVAVVNATSPLVGTACLELAPLPLHLQIQEFGKKALAAGLNRLQIVPLFLLPGVHVMEDIPDEVVNAQPFFGSNLSIEIRPHLGVHPGLGRLLATQMTVIEAETWILLSHGSRRLNANQPVEALATQLGAVSAYWSVPPSLEARVKALVEAGYRKIAILPYFLFAGGITDAIAQTVELISQQFPDVELRLTPPIGASAELANLILDLTKE